MPNHEERDAYQGLVGLRPEDWGWGKYPHSALERVGHIMQFFSDMDRKIMTLRYGLDGGGRRTYKQIADAVGRSRETVRQRESAALRRLWRDKPKTMPWWTPEV